MTDIVLVALIGVAGTLIGGVAGPLVKERLDRRARRRDETRREIGEILAKVDALLMEMLTLSPSQPEWRTTRREVVALNSQLSYLVGKGEGEIPGVLGYASLIATADGTKATNTANELAVSAATALVAAWYRGERSEKGIEQQVHDMWQSTYDAVVSGVLLPNGEEVDRSELDETELQRRDEIEQQGGVVAVTRRQTRRFWPVRR